MIYLVVGRRRIHRRVRKGPAKREEAYVSCSESFREDDVSPSSPGPVAEFTIAVYRNPTEHKIRLQHTLKWSEHTTREGPAGITKRQRVRTLSYHGGELIEEPSLPCVLGHDVPDHPLAQRFRRLFRDMFGDAPAETSALRSAAAVQASIATLTKGGIGTVRTLFPLPTRSIS
jgi:hypothetical protein